MADSDNIVTDTNPKTWPSLGAELFDLLTGRRAEIIYHLDNMEVHVPAVAHAGDASPVSAVWKFNGAVRIRSRILDEVT